VLITMAIRVLAVACTAFLGACVPAASVQGPEGAMPDDEAVLTAALEYFHARSLQSPNQPDGELIAIHVGTARIPGANFDPETSVEPRPEVILRVAEALGAPTGAVDEMTRCGPGIPNNCEVIGAGTVIGVGRIAIDGDSARVGVVHWWPSSVARFNLGGSAVILGLQRSGAGWEVVDFRPLWVT
jgi:hypothetical protein